MEVCHYILRLALAQVNTLMPVPQEQFATVAEIAVYHKDPWSAVIRQAEEQFFLDLMEIPRLNEILAVLFLPGKGKQVVPNAELRRQKRINKCNVVVNSADLEDLFAA